MASNLRPSMNELAKKFHQQSKEKGWHDEEWSNKHLISLVFSELYEFIGADRSNNSANMTQFRRMLTMDWKGNFEDYIKDSREDEIADVMIRLLDLAGLRKVELSRGLRIGEEYAYEKYDIKWRDLQITEIVLSLTNQLPVCDTDHRNIGYVVRDLIWATEWIARKYEIDLWTHVYLKMEYNKLRPQKHGKGY